MKTKRCYFYHVIGKKDDKYLIIDGFYSSLSPRKTRDYAYEVYGSDYEFVDVQKYNCDSTEVLVK